MIKVGSDCAGVGAFTQSLKRLKINYRESFACDFDFFARQTYLLNFGTKEDIELSNSKEHKKYADGVKRIALSSEKPTIEENAFLLEANEFAKKFSFYYPFNMYQREIPQEPCDIYISSVPCQAFSMAGKRLGKEDQRGVLFFNSLEFIQENKPRYFIFENVKGLLSHDKVDPKAQYGRTFQEWINYLGGKSVNGVHTFFPYEDAVPYHIYFQVLNAKDYNIPQNRERIFIIGIRDDEDNNFQFPKELPLEKRLKDVLESEVNEKYFLSDTTLKGILGHERKVPFIDGSESHSNCIISGYYKIPRDGQFVDVTNFQGKDICNTIRTGGKGSLTDKHNWDLVRIGAIRGRNPENPKSREAGLETEQMLEINENGTSNALTTVQKDNVVVISANTSKGFDEAEEEEDSINFSVPNSKTRRGRVGKKVSQTLDTQCNQGIYTKQRIRRLTPTEAFRLMDFNFGIDGVPDFVWNVSDSQAYKQAGNSIAVGVLAAIIEKLKL